VIFDIFVKNIVYDHENSKIINNNLKNFKILGKNENLESKISDSDSVVTSEFKNGVIVLCW